VHNLQEFYIGNDVLHGGYEVVKGERVVKRTRTLAAAIRYIKKNTCVKLYCFSRGGEYLGSKIIKFG
jgi:hypothetical protein